MYYSFKEMQGNDKQQIKDNENILGDESRDNQSGYGGLWLSWQHFILKWHSGYMGICNVILYTFCILKWCIVLLKIKCIGVCIHTHINICNIFKKYIYTIACYVDVLIALCLTLLSNNCLCSLCIEREGSHQFYIYTWEVEK